MTELPQGTVTLVFTDIEGSTRLLTASDPATRPHSRITAGSCGPPFRPTKASRSTGRRAPVRISASGSSRSTTTTSG